jgi:pimeloyl-ACP methyl ester carboxylesterase
MKTRLRGSERVIRRSALVLVALLLIAGCGGSRRPSAKATSTATIGTLVPGTRPTGTAAFLGPVRQVRAGGITIGYRQFGSGPPLLLIAGESSSMVELGPFLPRSLSRHFRVTEFDNRGVGYSSDQPARPLTIELMADDSAHLLDVLGIRKALVVGWSTGGEIALTLAVRHPGKVSALVTSGGTAGGPTTVQPSAKIEAAFRSSGLSAAGGLLGSLFPAPAAVAYAAGLLTIPPEKVSRQISKRQAQAEIRFARTNATYNGLTGIRVPALITNGALDVMVPPGNARLIARRIPRARLAIFAGAAHMMMFQDMNRFVELVKELAGHPLPRSGSMTVFSRSKTPAITVATGLLSRDSEPETPLIKGGTLTFITPLTFEHEKSKAS